MKCGACAYCVRIGSRVPPYTNIFSRARIFYFFLFLNDIKATSSSAISRHPPTRRLFTSFISLLTTHSDHRPSFIPLHCIALRPLPFSILSTLYSPLALATATAPQRNAPWEICPIYAPSCASACGTARATSAGASARLHFSRPASIPFPASIAAGAICAMATLYRSVISRGLRHVAIY